MIGRRECPCCRAGRLSDPARSPSGWAHCNRCRCAWRTCQDGGPPLPDRRPRAALLAMGHHHPPGRSAAADGTGPLIGSVGDSQPPRRLTSPEAAPSGQGGREVLGPADDYEPVAIEVAEVKHGWHATSEQQDLQRARELLDATRRVVVATGIASIWTHPPAAAAAAHRDLTKARAVSIARTRGAGAGV